MKTARPRSSELGSERQQALMFHDEAVRQHDQILDIFVAVGRLHTFDMHGLQKSINKAKGGAQMFVLSRGPGKTPIRIDVEKLTRALPLHLLACLLGRLPTPATAMELSSTVDLSGCPAELHLAQGMRLLAALCDMAANAPRLSHILEDTAFREQVVDLALLALTSMAGPDVDDSLRAAESSTPEGAARALQLAELVPTALQALAAGAGPPAVSSEGVAIHYGAGGPSGHFKGLADRMLAMPQAHALLAAMFDGTRTVIRMVRAALMTPVAAVDVYQLAFHAGVAMELLAELAATPLFYHGLMHHDPSAAAPLRLITAMLQLHESPLAPPPFMRSSSGGFRAVKRTQDLSTARGKGAAELLAARGSALLQMLCEPEEPAFLDSVAANPNSCPMAVEISRCVMRNTKLLILRPSLDAAPPQPGESQLALASMRAAEMLADDSNHRATIMSGLCGSVAKLLSLPPAEFESIWCGGAAAVKFHGDNAIALPISSITPLALNVAAAISATAEAIDMASSAKQAAERNMAVSGAMEQGILLFKLLGNLHAPPGPSQPDMPQDRFVNLVHHVLGAGDASRTAAANIATLAQWAAKLHATAGQQEGGPAADLLMTPEDLGLGRDFAAKLAALAASGQPPKPQPPKPAPSPQQLRPTQLSPASATEQSAASGGGGMTTQTSPQFGSKRPRESGGGRASPGGDSGGRGTGRK